MAEKKEEKKKIGYSETNANEKFSRDYFTDRVRYLSHLGQLKQSELKSTDARESFYAIDPSATSRDTEYALGNLEAMMGTESQALSGFTRKNFKDLAALVKEEDGLNLAINAPAIKAKGKEDADSEKEKARKEKEDKYNATVGIVASAQDVMERIKQDSNKYFTEQMVKMKIDPASAYGKFLTKRKEAVLEADDRISKMRAAYAVKKYGVSSYLTQAMSVATQYEKPTQEQEADEKKLQDMMMAIEIASDEKAKLTASKTFEEGQKKFMDKYKTNINAQGVIRLLTGGDMIKAAASAIEIDKRAAEEKKKTEERAKAKS